MILIKFCNLDVLKILFFLPYLVNIYSEKVATKQFPNLNGRNDVHKKRMQNKIFKSNPL